MTDYIDEEDLALAAAALLGLPTPGRMAEVVTYQSSDGSRINLCGKCEEFHVRKGTWPRSRNGAALTSVYRGNHYGVCQSKHHEESV